MGYQLVFWRQAPGNPPDPHAVYAQLMNAERVAELDELPGERFVARIAETFAKGWTRLGERTWEGDGAFQIETGPQHFLVTCYDVPYTVVNRLVDIGLEFECPLYDPQTCYRFQS